MKRIICTVLSLLLCFSFCSAEAFAAKDKKVKTGLKAEKISSFNIDSSDEVDLVATNTPLVVVYNKNDKIRFIDTNGKNINDKTYDGFTDELTELSEKDILVIAEAEGDSYKLGLLCADGTELFACEYDDVAVYDNELCVLVNLNGKDNERLIEALTLYNLISGEIYPIELPEKLKGSCYDDFLCKFSDNGYIHLGADGYTDDRCIFVFNPEGTLVISDMENYELKLYQDFGSHMDYSGFFSIGDALYNDNGELVTNTTTIIDSIDKELGLIAFYADGNYGLMDMEETPVLPPEYLISYVGEYGYVEKDGKYGLINKNGELFTELIYDAIKLNETGFATAKKGSHVGFINNEGKEITDFTFDKECYGWCFTEFGNCLVLKDGKVGMIDQTGKYIFKPEMDEKNTYCDQYTGYIKDGAFEFGEDATATFYMRSGAVVSVESGSATSNPELFEVLEKKKTTLIDYGGNVLVKSGENSEYITNANTEYFLGLVGKTVNVYQLVSK